MRITTYLRFVRNGSTMLKITDLKKGGLTNSTYLTSHLMHYIECCSTCIVETTLRKMDSSDVLQVSSRVTANVHIIPNKI